MLAYLVGGAVRDLEFGKVPNDHDYVVVGAELADMVAKGFKQVGADFPVFLHPETGDEYALARKEMTTGSGYHDFDTEFGPEVTLEEDLLRRDLTINAMAMDYDGNVVDPFGGRTDIKNKVLRHVSTAFADDPVRVLRLARFRAQFGPEWKVAESTKGMVKNMVMRGQLDSLTSERVSKELFKALDSAHPRLFFDTLDALDALETLFPVVHKMKSVEESLKWHPEGDTYEHTMLVLTAARAMNATTRQMFNALTHDFGKTLTDPADYPKHKMHEVTGVRLVNKFSDQMRVPADFKKHAALVCRYHMHMHKLDEMKSSTWVKMFDGLGSWNNPDVVEDLRFMGCADRRGKLGNESADVSDLQSLTDAFVAAKSVKFLDLVVNKPDWQSWSGERKAQVMKQGRTKAVQESRNG